MQSVPGRGSEKCGTDGCHDPPPDCSRHEGGIKGAPRDLKYLPRPEPNRSEKDDYDAWLKEYDEWGKVRCPGSCKKGYFCRQHGAWITGQEVSTGAAASVDSQGQDTCPMHHYNDDLPNSVLRFPTHGPKDPTVPSELAKSSPAV